MRKWLRKIILSRMHTMEMPAIKLPKMTEIKFSEAIWREGFTSEAVTEVTTAINRDETVKGPIYTEEDLIRRIFRSVR